MPRCSARLFPALFLLGSTGCFLVTPFSTDALLPRDSGPDAEADGDIGDADQDTDADVDSGDGGLAGPGPMTFVVSNAEVVVERIFDIDGDELPDNSVANLGEEDAAVFAMMLNTLSLGEIEGGLRQLFHIPWVDDRHAVSRPSATVISGPGFDTDDPEDLLDDFSGAEPFYADHTALDACGEPLSYFLGVEIVDGHLDGFDGTFCVPGDTPLPVSHGRIKGTISPGGSGGTVVLAGALLVGDLGGVWAENISPDLSMLELFLAGGASFGVPAVPGLSPDLDLDDDGLESFELDDESRLIRCVDGDFTVVEGRDCWQDARFADALSMTSRWHLVSAQFDGRIPNWELMVEGTCEEPPEESLFDP